MLQFLVFREILPSEPMSQDDYPATDEMEDILSILNDSDVLSESDKGDGRVFELIASLQASRTARTAGAAQGPDLEDEWENDDDNGYIAVGLTEEEFFEFENVSPSLLCPLIPRCVWLS